MELRTETQQAYDTILHTMACTDGGGRLLNLRSFIHEMDSKASDGDKDAQTILDTMVTFSRMINIATNNAPPIEL